MKKRVPEDVLSVLGTAIKGVSLAVRTVFALFTFCSGPNTIMGGL